jgi:hypothetical protein
MFSSMSRYRGLLAICAVLVISQALGASTTPVAAASTVSAPSKDQRHTLGEEDFTWAQALAGSFEGAVEGALSGAVGGVAGGVGGVLVGAAVGTLGGWLGQMVYNGFFGDATPEATSSKLVPQTALD